MSNDARRSPRRRDALSKRVIVRTAIDILDADGEEALTFRALAARLSTGAGALYHHVSNKDQLLAAAATDLVERVTGSAPLSDSSQATLRTFMLDVFDVIRAHPWLGAQLSRAPWQPADLLVFERIGELLAPLPMPDEMRFDVASAFMNHVLGVAAQQAAATRITPNLDRATFLEVATADWTAHAGRDRLPFVHEIAPYLAHHDDRKQFGTGVNLLLAGIAVTAGP